MVVAGGWSGISRAGNGRMKRETEQDLMLDERESIALPIVARGPEALEPSAAGNLENSSSRAASALGWSLTVEAQTTEFNDVLRAQI